MGMVFCRGCGKEIHETAPTCPHCGAPQFISQKGGSGQTDKRLLPLLLLGFIGLHYFYLGKTGKGIAFLLTLGGMTIWYFIDLFKIISGNFVDANGVKITQWT